MIVKFSLATLAVRLFAFFVGRYHRLRLVGQVALLRLVPKLHNRADDAVDDADDDADEDDGDDADDDADDGGGGDGDV